MATTRGSVTDAVSPGATWRHTLARQMQNGERDAVPTSINDPSCRSRSVQIACAGFLLRYISDRPLRQRITANTNKVETYNAFQQWIRFGKEGVLEENDPLEMEKLIKFTQLVANAIMLSNVLDMSAAIRTLLATGYVVTTQAVAELSPYLRQHIAR